MSKTHNFRSKCQRVDCPPPPLPPYLHAQLNKIRGKDKVRQTFADSAVPHFP